MSPPPPFFLFRLALNYGNDFRYRVNFEPERNSQLDLTVFRNVQIKIDSAIPCDSLAERNCMYRKVAHTAETATPILYSCYPHPL